MQNDTKASELPVDPVLVLDRTEDDTQTQAGEKDTSKAAEQVKAVDGVEPNISEQIGAAQTAEAKSPFRFITNPGKISRSFFKRFGSTASASASATDAASVESEQTASPSKK